jgi:hypothetical protein
MRSFSKMKLSSVPADPDFTEAEKYWHLEDLYGDLAQIERKSLSKREKQILRGRLLGYSPKEISAIWGNDNSNALRTKLAVDLYPLIKLLIQERTGEEVDPGGSRVLILLEQLAYRKALM